MPIEYGKPPADAEKAAAAGVVEVHRAEAPGRARARTLRDVGKGGRRLAAPLAVHNLRLSDLEKPGRLADAPMTAWRYLVEEAGATVASAEVSVDANGAVRGFDHLNEGPFVKATAAAQKAAAKLPQVRDGNVEARVIRIPALYVMALWLKNLDGDEDVVVPMAPAPAYLEANRPYTEQEFLRALAGPAKERAKFSNAPEAG
ncbi:MAG TPA: hypothetical protein VLB81_06865 [Gaiellales bacterium]|nr:hypothetical protein [Gaiellales bacterium]